MFDANIPDELLPLLRVSGQRLCLNGYASILRILTLAPATSVQVANAMQVSQECARMILRRMADAKIIHECDYVPRPHGFGNKLALYKFGPGARVACPYGPLPAAKGKNKRPELMAFCNLIAALQICPHTTLDLHDLTGFYPDAIRKLMRHGRAIGLIRIAEWATSDKGPPFPMFGLGDKRDSERPARMTNSERGKRGNAARGALMKAQRTAKAFGTPAPLTRTQIQLAAVAA